MLRAALRNVAGRKLRLLTTGLAVMLGVAFMTGTLVLTDTMQRTFDDLFASAYDGTDAVVRAEGVFDDPMGFGQQRGRMDESLVELVSSVDGVSVAQGGIFGYTQLVDKQGEPLGDPINGAPTVGANWAEHDELNVFNLASGRAPVADHEVAIDQKSADDTGYVAGDTAVVLVKGGPVEVTVTGIVLFGDSQSLAGATFVLFTTDAAQRLVAEPGRFDEISIVGAEGVSQEELVRRLEAALPPGVEALTGAAITAENQDAIRSALGFFNTFLLIFAVIALLVGGFIIFNSFFITVAQRTKEHALMRAIGASKRQILATVLIEALAVGVIASALGLVAGVAVAGGLKGLIGAMGFTLPASGITLTLGTAVTAFCAGVLVTLVSSISPARKAGKVPPIAAMRDVAVATGGYGSKERIVVGALILVGGGGLLLYGLFGDVSSPLQLVGLGVLLTFFGVSVLGRTVALPMSRVIGLPLPRLRGIAGRLARENAMRNPKRTAATASALMIGVGLVAFITIFASSTKASLDAAVDRTVTGDYVVTGSGGIDPGLAERLDGLSEVEVATGVRWGVAEVDGTVVDLLGADPAKAFDLFRVGAVAGETTGLDPMAIAVYRDTAEERGLQVGDKVPVLFKDTGRQELTVGLVYDERVGIPGEWLLALGAYEANFADQFDIQVFVRKAEGVDPEVALAAIEREAGAYPGTKVLDQTAYKAEQTAFVDQLLGLVYALLGLAILIALLGIGNTLALSIFERTRELGVLRAVGMTRNQLRSAIRWEAVIIALQGAILGLAIGVAFGWALVTALRDDGFTELVIPGTALAVMMLLAALAGLAAAALPARRAARLNVLSAVVSD
jgi:putative ABC transport system permease protein